MRTVPRFNKGKMQLRTLCDFCPAAINSSEQTKNAKVKPAKIWQGILSANGIYSIHIMPPACHHISYVRHFFHFLPIAFKAAAMPNPWLQISVAKQHRRTAMGATGAIKAEAKRTAAPSCHAHCKFMAPFRLSIESWDASRRCECQCAIDCREFDRFR